MNSTKENPWVVNNIISSLGTYISWCNTLTVTEQKIICKMCGLSAACHPHKNGFCYANGGFGNEYFSRSYRNKTSVLYWFEPTATPWEDFEKEIYEKSNEEDQKNLRCLFCGRNMRAHNIFYGLCFAKYSSNNQGSSYTYSPYFWWKPIKQAT